VTWLHQEGSHWLAVYLVRDPQCPLLGPHNNETSLIHSPKTPHCERHSAYEAKSLRWLQTVEKSKCQKRCLMIFTFFRLTVGSEANGFSLSHTGPNRGLREVYTACSNGIAEARDCGVQFRACHCLTCIVLKKMVGCVTFGNTCSSENSTSVQS